MMIVKVILRRILELTFSVFVRAMKSMRNNFGIHIKIFCYILKNKFSTISRRIAILYL